jgi:hypothetical protein
MLQHMAIALTLAQGAASAPAQSETERARSIAELMPCDASKARQLVGSMADTRTVARAIKLSGSYNVRIVRPGDPISMDYQTDRITIELDDNNKVVRLSCG